MNPITLTITVGIPERSVISERVHRGDSVTLNILGIGAGPAGVGIGVQVVVDGRTADEFALESEPMSWSVDLAPLLRSAGMVLLAPPCDVVLKPFVTTPRKVAPDGFVFDVETVSIEGVSIGVTRRPDDPR